MSVLRKKIKIKYVDFWGDITSEYFMDILKTKYEVEISDDPDLLFFSVYSDEHLKYNCFKIFYTGENVKPNPRSCDYSYSFEPQSKTNFQLPYFAQHKLFDSFITDTLPSSISNMQAAKKKLFCN